MQCHAFRFVFQNKELLWFQLLCDVICFSFSGSSFFFFISWQRFHKNKSGLVCQRAKRKIIIWHLPFQSASSWNGSCDRKSMVEIIRFLCGLIVNKWVKSRPYPVTLLTLSLSSSDQTVNVVRASHFHFLPLFSVLFSSPCFVLSLHLPCNYFLLPLLLLCRPDWNQNKIFTSTSSTIPALWADPMSMSPKAARKSDKLSKKDTQSMILAGEFSGCFPQNSCNEGSDHFVSK